MPKKLPNNLSQLLHNIVFQKEKNQERCPHKFFTTAQADAVNWGPEDEEEE